MRYLMSATCKTERLFFSMIDSDYSVLNVASFRAHRLDLILGHRL